MTAHQIAGPQRFAGPTQSARTQTLVAATTVATIASLAVTSVWIAPIAFLAAGAGAGYSLSGSV